MTTFNIVSLLSDSKGRSCLFITALICGAYFFGSAFLANDCREIIPIWNMNDTSQISQSDDCQISPRWKINDSIQNTQSSECKNQLKPSGSEALPEGIITKTSNLEMRPLWEPIADNVCPPLIRKEEKSKPAVNLLAIAVGIKQKQIVNQIIEKFPANDFVVMLFHYDGVVDEWSDFGWSSRVIHVSAKNQTKWWFAKRFLHPDIVAEYDYIFLWDEDLGVKNFHPGRYLSIVEDEGFEISQPALDPTKSRVHHQITARRRQSRVHRRIYKFKGSERCDDNSTAPPCIGWVEMMAPVFSREAWQCAWYLIQNDLIYLWGLDLKLGYCAQGDRTKNVGVVDSEYIVHLALPTLGISNRNKSSPDHFSQAKHLSDSDALESSVLHHVNNRIAVRRQSYIEMKIFEDRWNDAVKEDKCWVDPYQQPPEPKKRQC